MRVRSFGAAATRATCLLLVAMVSPATLLQAQRPTVRDSAGIQIVHSSAPTLPATQAIKVDAAPFLVIGTQDGVPYELTRVRGAARLANGSIVVADGGSTELRLFNSEGKFDRVLGRKGGGPGEFASLDGLQHLRGDTLVVMTAPARAVYYDGAGTFLWNVSHFSPGDRSGMKGLIGAFADGTTLLMNLTNPSPRSAGTRWLEYTSLTLADRKNTNTRTLAEVPLSMFVMRKYPEPPWFAAPMAFANDDSTIYVGLGTEYSIRKYSRDGRLQRIIRRAWTPTKVTSRDIDQYVVEWGKRWIKSTGADAERERSELRDAAYEKEVPAFSRFLLDGASRLWVRTPDLRDAPRAGQLYTMPLVPSSWSVFDKSGAWLSNVTLPANFHPVEIGADYLLAIARDTDGVETVVMHRVRNAR